MTGDQSMWRKSSYSGSETNCVEAVSLQDVTAVRDSKNQDGGELRVPHTTWRAFVRALVRA